MQTLTDLKIKANMLGMTVTTMKVGDAKPFIWFNHKDKGWHLKSCRGMEKAMAWLDEQDKFRELITTN